MSALNKIEPEDTIASIATPPGKGALGIIRISGRESIKISNAIFKGNDITKAASHTVHYGMIKDKDKIVDEVMLSIFKAPRTYTKENMVEISCHGSSYIQQQILQLIIKKGARLAKPGEFTLRAFLNGRIDLSQAEAVADLINADNEAAHALAINQIREGYAGRMKALREQLIHFASLVELELDFSEEDVEFANKKELKKLVDEIIGVVKQLIDSFALGNVIKHGVTTVITGRVNAGKSTLLNALLNEERAIVSDIPGTTRDTIEEMVNIDGIVFRLIDTAGIREVTGRIEAMGLDKTLQKIRQAAVIIYLFDVVELSSEELKKDIEKLNFDKASLILVGNKIDKVDFKKAETKFKDIKDILFLSSKEKVNLDKLKKGLFELVGSDKIKEGQVIVTNVRHYEALTKAESALQDVLSGIDKAVSGDLLALDIRRALHSIGEITGEVTTEDLLGNIFADFCIGK